MALALNAPRFDAEPLERVRGQLNAVLKRESRDPDSMAAQAWRRAAWPNHPYARSSRGEMGEIESVTRDDLVAFARKMLARDTLKVAAVGAIDAPTLARHLDALFAGLPEKAALAPVPQIDVQGLGRRIVVDYDVPQANIRFGRPGIARRDPDYIPAMVVNHILGGGAFTSRLWQEVREKRGLTYSVYSSLATADHSPCFIGSTSTKNERAAESLSVIEAEFVRLAAEGPTADELEKAQEIHRRLLCPALRHLDQDRRPSPAIAARGLRRGLSRPPQFRGRGRHPGGRPPRRQAPDRRREIARRHRRPAGGGVGAIRRLIP